MSCADIGIVNTIKQKNASTAAAILDTNYSSSAIAPAEKFIAVFLVVRPVSPTKSVRCSVPDGQDAPSDKICADGYGPVAKILSEFHGAEMTPPTSMY